ncbi:tetratricopeptide repeat protein [bacterium]|nr:tetratricopeptide repeat protein [bacterium]
MQSIIRFLSGEVPGGIFFLLTICGIILFIANYLRKHSEIIDKRKLRNATLALIGFLCFTYAIVRLARPPKPIQIHVAIFPFEFRDNTGSHRLHAYQGLGWGMAEMATRIGEMQSPPHLTFLRPEWITGSFGEDSTAKFSQLDSSKLLSWANLLGIDYVAAGSFEIKDQHAILDVHIYNSAEHGLIRSFQYDLPLTSEWTPRAKECATELIQFFYQETDYKFNPTAIEADLYNTPSLMPYFQGQLLMSVYRYEDALSAFQEALKADSSSLLAWYGTGLAYGELSTRTNDDQLRKNYQARMEYHLKRAGQLDEKFEPAYTALADFYMSIKPEPRYLDAEFALIAAHTLYDRDYLIYDLLSYMQKIRWESFNLKTKEEILKKAIAANPASFYSYLALGKYYIDLSRPNDHFSQLALNNFLIAQKLRPNDIDATLGLVTAYDHLNYFDPAITLLNRASQINPDNAEVYYSLGILYFHVAGKYKAKKQTREELAQYPTAEMYFKKALQIKNYPYVYLYLGKIYEVQNKRDEAIAAFRAAMKLLDRDDPYREEARKKLREYFPDAE